MYQAKDIQVAILFRIRLLSSISPHPSLVEILSDASFAARVDSNADAMQMIDRGFFADC